MTQDVQPLTWSKRTNIEEHQQFFSKINEIISNLAPTVDEAEQAIAQATAAIASANDAVATANAASAAASAAASQAQTAASTVAGYDGRLTAAEGDIDTLKAADQTMGGNISALGTRMTAAESKNSQQDTDIAALQTADGQNVKINRINDYAIGLTGNQEKTGIVTFVNPQKGTWEGNRLVFSTATGGKWYKIGEIINKTTQYSSESITWIISSNFYNAADKAGVALFHLIIPNASGMSGFIPVHASITADVWTTFMIKVGKKADGTIEIFAKGRDYTAFQFNPISIFYNYGSLSANDTIVRMTATEVPEPQAEDYVDLITVTI